MPATDRQLARLVALAIAAHKNGDATRARKLLDAAIKHAAKPAAPVMQQQQQIQPTAKKKP